MITTIIISVAVTAVSLFLFFLIVFYPIIIELKEEVYTLKSKINDFTKEKIVLKESEIKEEKILTAEEAAILSDKSGLTLDEVLKDIKESSEMGFNQTDFTKNELKHDVKEKLIELGYSTSTYNSTIYVSW